MNRITSLCIRVARDYPRISEAFNDCDRSVLILGSPGSGKTTLLRDLIRKKSDHEKNCVAVVDERCEIFPVVEDVFCFSTGLRTEVLSGCKKSIGIGTLIRTMNPKWIAVDEITADEDCNALIQACWCGVKMMATAHAENMRDFMNRPVYKPLITSGVFHNFIVMNADKTWKMERTNLCI